MKKLRIGVVDILARDPVRSAYARVMRANLAAIMPQVVAVWSEQLGHEVHLSYMSGPQCLTKPLPDDLDIVFMSAFTTSAYVAYALSRKLRETGTITVLGGPHARSYPDDARAYFDYVVGFVDKDLLGDILADHAQHRPRGQYLSARQQPQTLPSVRDRWKHIEDLFTRAPWIKIVSMIGSLGCPYQCSFCVDSTVKYQPLDYDAIKDDLRFVSAKMKNPIVGWHDPNFGVRFNDYLDLIEEAVPKHNVKFIAESTLSLLNEANVKRLKKNGFAAILPGIESWYDMGNKSKTGSKTGQDKVEAVADQVNMIQSQIPYFQGNFVVGLDCDEGAEPFELTKQFLDRCPGAFPAFSMLTAFGISAPANAAYYDQNRIVEFPFHFLNNNGAMNVRPLNYDWIDFYDRMIDLHEHAFSGKLIVRRARADRGFIPRTMNVIRATSSEGWGKIKYFKWVRQQLREDREFRDFFEGASKTVPAHFRQIIRNDLGPLMNWLPLPELR